MITDGERTRKLPVWQALSELFLDTELQVEDYRRIARTLAASGYGERALRRILDEEVAPAFAINMLSVAGEWAGWSDAEVRERVERQMRRARPLRWLRRLTVRAHVNREWAKLRVLLAADG